MTLAETMIATAIMMTVTGGVFTLLDPAHGTFQAQTEVADQLQRLRVGVDALAKDLLMATAVQPSGPGAISIRYRPSADAEVITRTYFLKADTATHAFQLMRRDDAQVDLPVLDRVVKLEFEYVVDEYLCIRRIRVTLGVQARFRVPDQEMQFDIAPRNMNGGASTCSSLP